jgi:hypothetical protein
MVNNILLFCLCSRPFLSMEFCGNYTNAILGVIDTNKLDTWLQYNSMTVPGASIVNTERTKALGIGMSIDGRRTLEMAEVMGIVVGPWSCCSCVPPRPRSCIPKRYCSRGPHGSSLLLAHNPFLELTRDPATHAVCFFQLPVAPTRYPPASLYLYVHPRCRAAAHRWQ